MPFFLFLLTVLSRIPFTAGYLYHSDAGQFALALNDYDLVLHQPHPPGYFLYVMLGRLAVPCAGDANAVFIVLSIVFSGLTVVAVYYLGKELFDRRTGVVSALLAVVSPNFWFHGEAAFTYPVEAFFSALTGLFCWRMYQGRKGYLWYTTIVLALAGGFRQNTPVFLLPLLLFSVRREPFRRVLAAVALFGIVALAWFLPMIRMTGGPERYLEAFRELWLFSTGHNSVFEKGLPQFVFYARNLHTFLLYTLGAALPLMLLALYALIRNGKTSLLKGPKTAFLVLWVLPSLLFHLLIFIHPTNPGYVLILLSPLMVMCAAAISYLGTELFRLTGKGFNRTLAGVVMLANAGIFLFSPLPVSHKAIVTHDANIAAIVSGIGAFDPKTTALFAGPYSFYSYRHLMVYLPEFNVYQVDVRTGPTGERRKQFGGRGGKTFLTERIQPPTEIKNFAAVVIDDPTDPPHIPPGVSSAGVAPEILIVSGPIEKACDLYPEISSIWGTATFPPDPLSRGAGLENGNRKVTNNANP